MTEPASEPSSEPSTAPASESATGQRAMRIGGIVLVALGVVIVALYLWPAFHDPANQLDDDLAEHGCEAGSPLAGWWRLSPHADVPISCDTGCPDQQETQIVRFERKLGGTWELATAVVVPTSCEPASD